MSISYRTFIALKIKPHPLLLELLNKGRIEFNNESVKWVDASNLHLTLKFLGDTSLVQITSVKEILSQTSERCNPFQFNLNGLGYFKSGGQPKILFTRIEPVHEMKRYVAVLENSLAEIGFQKEKRSFKPHLTLGRIKFLRDKRKFYNWIDKNESFEITGLIVDEVTYFQSILSPKGPVYKTIYTVNLKS